MYVCMYIYIYIYIYTHIVKIKALPLWHRHHRHPFGPHALRLHPDAADHLRRGGRGVHGP